MATTKPLTLVRGKTFQLVIRWETTPIIYKPITAISQTAPARITSPGHSVPEGWRCVVVSVKGMRDINAKNPISDRDYHEVTVVDADTIELNDVNAADYAAYTSGGYLRYNMPHDLTGYKCRAIARDKVGGVVLLSTEAADAPNNLLVAVVDTAEKTISLSVAATVTAALAWKKGVWEVEMESPTGIVYPLIAISPATVSDEVAA